MTDHATAFERLVTIMGELREQCPWDRKQTIQSLRNNTIEEMYELADAITGEDWKGIKEELGDLLLHIVFYSKIAAEQQQFSLAEMIHGICDKLVYRHPHIYGNVQVEGEEEVLRNWEQLKLKEGKGEKTVLGGVPRGLPALVKAIRIQEKVKQVGFEWKQPEDVFAKIQEEMEELREAVQSGPQEEVENELGDVLFSLVNYARFLNVNAEAALERTNHKFMDRFNRLEALAKARGQHLPDMTLEEMDGLWNEIKKQTH
jgi:MazG family protein